MPTLAEKFEAAKKCCLKVVDRNGKRASKLYNRIFDLEWEVLVVKRDKETGKFITKLACCALTPV